MKRQKGEIRVGDFVFTNDGVGSGIVKRVGFGYIDIYNKVQINKYPVDECEGCL